VNVWKAQVRTAYSAGSCTVRRQGESTNRTVSAGRHLSAAVAGDWVLVVEDLGQCWAVMMIGTGPAAYPDNPPIDGGTAESVLNIPPAWTGRITVDNNADTTTFAGADGWTFGRYQLTIPPYTDVDLTYSGLSEYPGLLGLAISEASLLIVAPDRWPSATAQLALFSAPADAPAEGALAAGVITQVDAIDGPDFPTPDAGSVITLPGSWRDHLAAGTANAVGLIDSGSTPLGVGSAVPSAPVLNITYQ